MQVWRLFRLYRRKIKRDFTYNIISYVLSFVKRFTQKREVFFMKMYENHLTVGLFDRRTKKQEISTTKAKELISNVLINHYGIYAFTMIECYGVYKMQDTGEIVKEPSIRIEIASEHPIKEIKEIIRVLKHKRILNQESIMHKQMINEINFR